MFHPRRAAGATAAVLAATLAGCATGNAQYPRLKHGAKGGLLPRGHQVATHGPVRLSALPNE